MTFPKKVSEDTKHHIHPPKEKSVGQLGKRPIVSLGQGCSKLAALVGVVGLVALGVGIAAYGAHSGWWSLGPLNRLSELHTIRILEIGGGASLLTPLGAAGWGMLEISHLRRALSHSQANNQTLLAEAKTSTENTSRLEKRLEKKTTTLAQLKKEQKKQIDRLQEQVNQSQARVEELNTEIERLNAQLKKTQQKKSESVPVSQEGEKPSPDQEEMLNLLKGLTNVVNQYKEEQSQENQKYQQAVGTLTREKQKYQEALDTLTRQVRKRENQICRLGGVKFGKAAGKSKGKKLTLSAPIGQKQLGMKGPEVEQEKVVWFPQFHPRVTEKMFLDTLLRGAPSLSNQEIHFLKRMAQQLFVSQRAGDRRVSPLRALQAPPTGVQIKEVDDEFVELHPSKHLTPQELYDLGYRYPHFAAQKHQTFLDDYRYKLVEAMGKELEVFHQEVSKAAEENPQNALLPFLQKMLLALMNEESSKSEDSFNALISCGRTILEHTQFKNPKGKDITIKDNVVLPFLEVFFWIYWHEAEAYGYLEANLRATVELTESISLDKEAFLRLNREVQKSKYNKKSSSALGAQKARGETGYEDFCGKENHPQVVNEHIYANKSGEEKWLRLRRHGNPTYWGEVTSDYKFYLTLLEKEKKSLLYCQYQRRGPKKGWARAAADKLGATESEDNRVAKIEALQISHKNFHCLTQPVEEDLFDRKRKYAGKSLEELKTALESEFFDKKDSSAALPSYLTGDKTRKENYRIAFKKLLADVETLFFSDKTLEWNDTSWKNYLLLFYAFQRRDLLFRLDQVNGCSLETYNTTCKDDLDRGGNQRFVEYLLGLLHLGELDDPKRKEEVLVQILGPTQAVKTQGIIPERIEPGLDLLAYLKTLSPEQIAAYRMYTFGEEQWKFKAMPPANRREDQTAIPRDSRLIEAEMRGLIAGRDMFSLSLEEHQQFIENAKKIVAQYPKYPKPQWERFREVPSTDFFKDGVFIEPSIKKQIVRDFIGKNTGRTLISSEGRKETVSSYDNLKKQLLSHSAIANNEQKALQVLACFNQSSTATAEIALRQKVFEGQTIVTLGHLGTENSHGIEMITIYELDLSGPKIRFRVINHAPLNSVDPDANSETLAIIKNVTKIEFSEGENLLKTESRFSWSIIK